MSTHKGWIGVDLDGTLAEYNGWQGPEHIGLPVKPMVDRVKKWLAEGKEVRIFTARVSGDREGVAPSDTRKTIEAWCVTNLGQKLAVTCTKDFAMIELWDDRAITVLPNRGIPAYVLHQYQIKQLLDAAGVTVTDALDLDKATASGSKRIGDIVETIKEARAEIDGVVDALNHVDSEKVGKIDSRLRDDLDRAKRVLMKLFKRLVRS